MKLNQAQKRRFKEVMGSPFTLCLLGLFIGIAVVSAICGNTLWIYMVAILVLMLLKIAMFTLLDENLKKRRDDDEIDIG